HPPDLPQSPRQRDQVYAAGRRDLGQSRMDRIGRTISERQGYRSGNPRGGNPDRARLLWPRFEFDQVGRARGRAWFAYREKPRRSPWRLFSAKIETSHRHRSDRYVSGRGGHGRARPPDGAEPADAAACAGVRFRFTAAETWPRTHSRLAKASVSDPQ